MAPNSDDSPGKKRGRKVRVDFRKNREKVRRDKSEHTRQFRAGEPGSADAPASESVRAKGALSRRRTIIEDGDKGDDHPPGDGRVTAVRGLVVEVESQGRRWACTVRRVLRTRMIEERSPVAVGDAVQFSPVSAAGETSRLSCGDELLPEGVIESVAPRRTTLVRYYEHRSQVIAANVDTVVVTVAADQPTLRPHLIDRYLISIHQGDMRPVICINKADLDTDAAAAAVADDFSRLGYRAILTSVPRQRGLDDLRDAVRDITSVFVGPSGVGKSTLINALAPHLAREIGDLTDLHRGKHTTTTAQLLRWPFGGHVVDTPGMRQFELPPVAREELEAYFIEFVERVAHCRFADCSHVHEADCAIRAAVDAGDISPRRYGSYCKMYEECAARSAY
jgi:ribosome biogenesis GTPase